MLSHLADGAAVGVRARKSLILIPFTAALVRLERQDRPILVEVLRGMHRRDARRAVPLVRSAPRSREIFCLLQEGGVCALYVHREHPARITRLGLELV